MISSDIYCVQFLNDCILHSSFWEGSLFNSLEAVIVELIPQLWCHLAHRSSNRTSTSYWYQSQNLAELWWKITTMIVDMWVTTFTTQKICAAMQSLGDHIENWLDEMFQDFGQSLQMVINQLSKIQRSLKQLSRALIREFSREPISILSEVFRVKFTEKPIAIHP